MQPKEQAQHDNRVSNRILLGLLAGTLIGIGFNYWGDHPARDWILVNVLDPIGQVFLRGLFLVVVPLVLSSLAVGVTNLGSEGHLKRLGWRLALYYVTTTLIAVVIGQILVTAVRPGDGVPESYLTGSRSAFTHQVSGLLEKSTHVNESLWPGIITTIVPKNIFAAMAAGDMLAIILVAILFGIALMKMDPLKADPTIKVLQAISEASICLVGWIMELAPVAVGALMVNAVSRFGIEVLQHVALYVVVVLSGFVFHLLITYSLALKYLVGIAPWQFYRRAFPAIATAFSTSSSNASIPTTIRTLETQFGVPKSITTFSIPLGATINMDGTALFEVVAALFVAQVFGVEVGLTAQITLILLVILTSVGVAGVPGGSIPILMSAMATMGIPPEGIALILGVDRLLDMGRTTVNVTGDMTATLYLARVENVPLESKMRD